MKNRSIMRYDVQQKQTPTLNIPSEISIRKIGKFDCEALAEVFFQSYHQTVDDEDESVEDWMQELKAVEAEKYGTLLTDYNFYLYHEDDLIGCILCSEFKGIPLILYIVITPAYQGRRLARILLNQVFQKLHTNDQSSIYLVVTDDNLPAIKTYQYMGFHKVGTSWMEVLKDQEIKSD